MFSPKRIRSQMYFGVFMLMFIVTVLSAASLQGVLKFRKLTKSIHERSLELPKAAELGHEVSALRSHIYKDLYGGESDGFGRLSLQSKVQSVDQALEKYRIQLENCQTIDPRIGEKSAELEFVVEFERRLETIRCILDEEHNASSMFAQSPKDDRLIGITYGIFDPLENELSELQRLSTEIPVFMQQRMTNFAERARTEYHAWMMASILLGVAALVLIGYIVHQFRLRIIRPLETLLEGSRQVASGNYDYRIQLNSDDEVAELGDALNAMTASFQEIESDLNDKVQQRTKEVVRSEKMASVGFLAAGIAHEINNPLATIAWSAESLETRIRDILDPAANLDDETFDSEVADMEKYLRRIQDEAFRCKGITAGLLNFSRMGDVQKVATNLVEVIDSVIEMVKPLSKYRGRNIVFNAQGSISIVANEQEMKQVALNLITNALGSVDEGGTVEISLKDVEGQAELTVNDDGCGMSPDVLQHLFEPFFTRRRDGQGTGLGLSITFQIIEEHGGRIYAHSAGPGKGSSFTVSLPLVKNEGKKLAKSAA